MTLIATLLGLKARPNREREYDLIRRTHLIEVRELLLQIAEQPRLPSA